MDCVIDPRREKHDPILPGLGFLFVNPSEARLAVEDTIRAGGRRHFLFNSNLAVARDGKYFVAGPAVGAPMAVLCLEKLIACGADTVIGVGWAGSLQPDIPPGTIIIPAGAVSDEGTSRHYPLSQPAGPATWLRNRLLDLAASTGWPVHAGPVWTTDAPYRETWSAVRRHRTGGILAVEMEYAALLTVAAFRKIDLAAIFLVSDQITDHGWQPAFRNHGFKERSRQLVALLLTHAEMLRTN